MKKTLSLITALGCCLFAIAFAGCSSPAATPSSAGTTSDDSTTSTGGGAKGPAAPSETLSKPAPPTK